MRIIKLEVENFQRVQALTVDADGNHVRIDGDNATGKTSAVTALECGLRGASVKDLKNPVHHGAKKAVVTIDLGDYRIVRSWSATAGMKIEVYNRDGLKQAKPQELLNSILSEYSIDPAAFLDVKPRERIDAVLAVYQVKPPVERVKKLTGDDHQPRPGEGADAYLDRLSWKDGVYYVRRAEAAKVFALKDAALRERRAGLAKLGGAVAGKPVSVSDLVKQMQALNQQSADRTEAGNIVAEAERDQMSDEAFLSELKADAESTRQQIAALQKQLADTEARIVKGEAHCVAVAKKVDEQRQLFKKMEDPAPKVLALQKQIAEHEANNAVIEQRQRATAAVATLQAEVTAAQTDRDKYDSFIKSIREMKAGLLNGLDLGFGLGIDDDGDLTLNGVSWSAASEAEQVIAACEIGCRQNPKLRLLRIDHGERFSERTRTKLLAWADEHDMQVVMTCVSSNSQLHVEIIEAQQRKEVHDEQPLLAGVG